MSSIAKKNKNKTKTKQDQNDKKKMENDAGDGFKEKTLAPGVRPCCPEEKKKATTKKGRPRNGRFRLLCGRSFRFIGLNVGAVRHLFRNGPENGGGGGN